MNDSSHFNYLYAYIITFCRFWHITGDFKHSTKIPYCSFYDKIFNSFKFPTIFPKECEYLSGFFSEAKGKERGKEGKRKAHLCSLVLSVSSLKT